MSELVYDQNGNPLFVNSNPAYMQGQSQATHNPVLVSQAPKAPFQTMKTFTGTVTTSTSAAVITTLYTVSSGKTFYLTDFVVCNNASYPAQVSVNGSATAGASPAFIGHSLNTAPLDALNIGTEPSVSAGNPVTFQTTATSTATTLTYFIAGYEQ